MIAAIGAMTRQASPELIELEKRAAELRSRIAQFSSKERISE